MTTPVVPSNAGWLRRLVSGTPHMVIGGTEDPYLLRWYVIPRNPMVNVYVHKFMRSDDDRALHDHPWWFVSLMLRGEYDEITDGGMKRRSAGSIAFRPAEWRHRVQLLAKLAGPGRLILEEVPCWTLIVTGRRVRTWGFWCKRVIDEWTARSNEELDRVYRNGGPITADRFVPWTEFGDAGCGEPQ